MFVSLSIHAQASRRHDFSFPRPIDTTHPPSLFNLPNKLLPAVPWGPFVSLEPPRPLI
ncbi:hypothetical protein DENSPDRAFT_845142 [Dentipellis sp. KUC8613]|nr:hypothetical protein DENSPDRAFT_845142 [Dentipellis sp. KUC8613]